MNEQECWLPRRTHFDIAYNLKPIYALVLCALCALLVYLYSKFSHPYTFYLKPDQVKCSFRIEIETVATHWTEFTYYVRSSISSRWWPVTVMIFYFAIDRRRKKFVFLSMPFHHLQSRACVSLYFRFAWVIGNAGAIETEARAKAGQVKQLNGICGLCTCRQIIPCKLWINLKQTDEPYTRICAWCWWHNENRQFRRLNGIFDKIPIRNFLSPILFLGKAIIEKLNKYSITSTLYMTISCKQI